MVLPSSSLIIYIQTSPNLSCTQFFFPPKMQKQFFPSKMKKTIISPTLMAMVKISVSFHGMDASALSRDYTLGLKQPRLDYTRVYYGLCQFTLRGILWPEGVWRAAAL